MYRGYKVVPFIPAGRKRTMELLRKYLEINKHIVDEVQVWVNTEVAEDVEYLRQLGENSFFKIMDYDHEKAYIRHPVQLNTHSWYKYTIDPKTIYIRFDDDIIYIEDDYFKNILDFRIDNPEYFLVFGNIWNNAISSYLHQQAGNIGKKHGVVEKPYCMDMIGWGSGPFAEYIHRILLKHIKKGTQQKLFLDKYELHNAHRFSISNFAFFGKDFKEFDGRMDFRTFKLTDEEVWLTDFYPKKSGRLNVICGNALVSHFTFSPHQKPHVLETDILDQYIEIADHKYSENYYNFLTPN